MSDSKTGSKSTKPVAGSKAAVALVPGKANVDTKVDCKYMIIKDTDVIYCGAAGQAASRWCANHSKTVISSNMVMDAVYAASRTPNTGIFISPDSATVTKPTRLVCE